MTMLELVCRDGLQGKKWGVKKVCKGWFYNNVLYLYTNIHGLPSGYTEYSGNAFWGSKAQAEKLMKLEQ